MLLLINVGDKCAYISYAPYKQLLQRVYANGANPYQRYDAIINVMVVVKLYMYWNNLGVNSLIREEIVAVATTTNDPKVPGNP